MDTFAPIYNLNAPSLHAFYHDFQGYSVSHSLSPWLTKESQTKASPPFPLIWDFHSFFNWPQCPHVVSCMSSLFPFPSLRRGFEVCRSHLRTGRVHISPELVAVTQSLLGQFQGGIAGWAGAVLPPQAAWLRSGPCSAHFWGCPSASGDHAKCSNTHHYLSFYFIEYIICILSFYFIYFFIILIILWVSAMAYPYRYLRPMKWDSISSHPTLQLYNVCLQVLLIRNYRTHVKTPAKCHPQFFICFPVTFN